MYIYICVFWGGGLNSINQIFNHIKCSGEWEIIIFNSPPNMYAVTYKIFTNYFHIRGKYPKYFTHFTTRKENKTNAQESRRLLYLVFTNF